MYLKTLEKAQNYCPHTLATGVVSEAVTSRLSLRSDDHLLKLLLDRKLPSQLQKSSVEWWLTYQPMESTHWFTSHCLVCLPGQLHCEFLTVREVEALKNHLKISPKSLCFKSDDMLCKSVR